MSSCLLSEMYNKGKGLLENIEELTFDEKVVLVYTRGLKNTYMGRKDIRFTNANNEMKISRKQWDDATEMLQDKKLLNKSKAITPMGSKLIGRMQPDEIKRTVIKFDNRYNKYKPRR